MVTDTGHLVKDSNLQTNLYYTCEVASPDAGDGEGVSTVQATTA